MSSIRGGDQHSRQGVMVRIPVLTGIVDALRFCWAMRRADAFRFVRFALPGHFYSAIPDMRELRARYHEWVDPRVKTIAGVELDEAAQLETLASIEPYLRDAAIPERKTSDWRYRLNNGWFSYGDGLVLHAMLRHLRPRRVLEIGSGYSSALMLDTDERYLGGATRFELVEPRPERLFGLLREGDRRRCRILREDVRRVDDGVFTALESGDLFFVDSSHVGRPGSDLLDIVNRILPLLRTGVIVHVHDVPWPFEYPMLWYEEGRLWNEAHMLRAFLQFNASFRILYFSAFMAMFHRDRLMAANPLMLGCADQEGCLGNTSLWLSRVA